MEEERYEKELFDFEKPKKRFFRFGKIFPKKQLFITLALDRLIIISIGIIMAMVIIYAFGVEMGKVQIGRMASIITSAGPSPEEVQAPPAAPLTQEAANEAKPESPLKSILQPEGVKGVREMPYTIVACTFASKETALEEMGRLKKKGFEPFVRQSGSYFQVCVGAYRNKDSVQSKKELAKIRDVYRDAYFIDLRKSKEKLI